MSSLINRYANDLLNYARQQNQLEDIYTYALILTQRSDWSTLSSIPHGLEMFLQAVPPMDVNAVLSKFINISSKYLGLLDVTVISAVPLTQQQRDDIENKLIRIYNKPIYMITKVDPTLLGGLRIITEHSIIDNTIKKKIVDLKKNIYMVVCFK